jgi:ribonucleoside-diphosphate reductase alpha chain
MGAEFEKTYLRLEVDPNMVLAKKVSARDLFKRIMKSQLETGMPYLFFKDTVNQANPNKHDGMIGSGNLCQESSPTLNLQKFKKNTSKATKSSEKSKPD